METSGAKEGGESLMLHPLYLPSLFFCTVNTEYVTWVFSKFKNSCNMGNPCISTFYTLTETSKQFQPHFIVPSAVPEKGEKEDKGDGNFPCERRRESLILQWRMEIENREPHLVPTYFCCAIQKKNSADDQYMYAHYYSPKTKSFRPAISQIVFRQLVKSS